MSTFIACWISACIGAIVIWPIAHSFGAQAQSDEFAEQMRKLRDPQGRMP